MKHWAKWGIAVLLLPIGFYGYRKLIPVYRVEVSSTLIMLGDLDGDHQWGSGDRERLDEFLKDPFAFSDAFAQRVDLNQNGLLDPEDVTLLRTLIAEPDPFASRAEIRSGPWDFSMRPSAFPSPGSNPSHGKSSRDPWPWIISCFLGTKEDGSDKSRHWNVFGGICLYKSAEEALDLALKREMKDLKTGGYSPEAMTEFIRDMIANLNGMYHVMVIDPDLLPRRKVELDLIPAG